VIIRNAAQCAKCGDIVESKHRHDFASCSCGSIFVDGGKEYLRAGGNLEYFISLAETDNQKVRGVLEKGNLAK